MKITVLTIALMLSLTVFGQNNDQVQYPVGNNNNSTVNDDVYYTPEKEQPAPAPAPAPKNPGPNANGPKPSGPPPGQPTNPTVSADTTRVMLTGMPAFCGNNGPMFFQANYVAWMGNEYVQVTGDTYCYATGDIANNISYEMLSGPAKNRYGGLILKLSSKTDNVCGVKARLVVGYSYPHQ